MGVMFVRDIVTVTIVALVIWYVILVAILMFLDV
jgi:hypothetical protein